VSAERISPLAALAASAVLLSLWLPSPRAFAHDTSRSYLNVGPDQRAGRIEARWEVAVIDLAVAMPLDSNNDSRVVWGEVLAQETTIQALVRANLKFYDSSGACGEESAPLLVDSHGGQMYIVAPITLDCQGEPGTLGVDYTFLRDIDGSHRLLVRMEGAPPRTLVIVPGIPREIGAAHASKAGEFGRYLAEGAHHIWIGYDHLAFLFALLLPAVLSRRRDSWQPVHTLRAAVLETLQIVSAFTVSHSITLGLAALGILRPPPLLIEVAIALSVAAAAGLNLLRRWKLPGAWLAFGFGFIHGFGFANALTDLGLGRGDIVIPLLGFNLGVEVGQLAVVAVILPLLYASRAVPAYTKYWLPAASTAIMLVGLYWTVVRWP
jgi:HupE / UreJ protein